MARKIKVLLPRGKRPRFPDLCVDCATAKPGGSVRISSPRWLRLLGWGLAENPEGARVVAAPACAACRGRLRAHKWLHGAVGGAILLGGLAAALFVKEQVGGDSGRFAAKLVGGGAALGGVLWWLLSPVAVSVSEVDEIAAYTFRNAEVARAFARANDLGPDAVRDAWDNRPLE